MTAAVLASQPATSMTPGPSATPEVDIAVVATFTADPVVEPLQLLLSEAGLTAAVELAPYAQVFQSLLDPGSALGRNSRGANVVLVRFEDWCQKPGSTAPIAQDALERSLDDFIAALRPFAGRSAGLCLVGLCPPSPPAQREPATAALLAGLEDRVVERLADLGNVSVLRARDLFPTTLASGWDEASDRLGHVPFTAVAFAELANTLGRRVYAHRSPPHKVIALDCDNTLWGGVVGEDGVDGIQITPAHRALQAFAVRQQQKGMLLALVSKNVEQDVREVLDARTDMVLKSEHLVALKVNWLPKSENLRALASELNLGLDSFIFVDDNPVECAEVEASCPGVLALRLPLGEDLGAFLENVWAFDQARVTDEDRRRTELYRQNLERDRYQKAAPTLAEFLAGLDLRIQIAAPTADQIPRTSQLSNRTNQFNTTTKRRSEAEVSQLAEQGLECRVVTVSDRFGDYGLVGCFVFGKQGRDVVVDSLMLSCRVLGRGVEHTMIRHLGDWARQQGLARVLLPFRPTKKNLPAKLFLDGLEAVINPGSDGEVVYTLSTEQAVAAKQREGAPDPLSAVADEGAKEKKKEGARGALDGSKSTRWNKFARTLSTPAQVVAAVAAAQRRTRTSERALREAETPTERLVAGIFREILNLPEVGVDDDYFELGGTSLLAVGIMARIERTLGKRLPLSALIDDPTVARLARRLDGPTASHLVVPLATGGSGAPLFLVHDADGETMLYRNLARRLGDDRPIYALQPAPLDGSAPIGTRIEDMAERYVSEIRRIKPHGPYLLGGMCAGGIIAFEMARQLERAGETAHLCAVIDAADVEAAIAPNARTSEQRKRGFGAILAAGSPLAAAKLAASKVRNVIRYEARSRATRLRNRAAVELIRRLQPGGLPLPAWIKSLPIRAIYLEAEAVYRPSGTCTNEIVLFRATAGTGADKPYVAIYTDPLLGWGKRAERGVRPVDVPGGHSSMLQEPNVAVMADSLRAYLAEIAGPRSTKLD